MALTNILIGAVANDGTGDPLRTAFGKINTNNGLFSTVALSGAYADLTGKPALATVATTGVYSDLTGRPAFAAVATSGAYSDLSGAPTLAAVATSGAYADLSGTPTIPTATPIRPPLIAGNFYPAFPSVMSTGSIVAINSMKLIPLVVHQTCTILTLGVLVNTLATGGNCQLALYASNPTTGRPTGTALGNTASISTAATGAATGNMGASVQLTAGTLYWLAINCDNSTNLFISPSGTMNAFAWLVGSVNFTDVISATTAAETLVVAQTFGTWPDLTAASFTMASGKGAMIAYKVASVP